MCEHVYDGAIEGNKHEQISKGRVERSLAHPVQPRNSLINTHHQEISSAFQCGRTRPCMLIISHEQYLNRDQGNAGDKYIPSSGLLWPKRPSAEKSVGTKLILCHVMLCEFHDDVKVETCLIWLTPAFRFPRHVANWVRCDTHTHEWSCIWQPESRCSTVVSWTQSRQLQRGPPLKIAVWCG